MTASSVELFWTQPLDDGGCALDYFEVLRDDDGTGANYVTVYNTASPSVSTYTVINLPASPAGLTLRFKVRATNIATYSVDSYYTLITIASTPSAPASAPTSDLTVTNRHIVRIIYSAPSNGGSTITNYEIQMDDGLGGGFFTIAGGS